jgi:hypothetical protein
MNLLQWEALCHHAYGEQEQEQDMIDFWLEVSMGSFERMKENI